MFHDYIAEYKFSELQKRFGFDTCIETGTFCGMGAIRASQYCDVITVEINNEYLAKARAFWVGLGCKQIDHNLFRHGDRLIKSLVGNSPDILNKVLPSLRKKRICFYLDAHWNKYWPLLDELKAIAESGCKNCIVIIHDCKVPGKDFHYDSYDGVDLDYDYVKEGLQLINQNFTISYNEDTYPRLEPNSASCGILYATPKR